MTSRRSGQLALSPRYVRAVKIALTRTRPLLPHNRRVRTSLPGRVLYYHRITDDDDALAVSPRRFAEQMSYLESTGHVCKDLKSALTMPVASDGRVVVGLTFDDGYADVADTVRSTLSSHQFSATVFVVPGVLDGSARFSWVDTMPEMLRWDDVRDLDGGPLWFESHTLTHPNLIGLPGWASWREIAESRQRLSAELGRTVSCLAYPAGAASNRERFFALGAGYEYGVTCEPGINVATGDPLRLRRTAIERHDRLVDFRAKLEGVHDEPLLGQRLYRHFRGLAAD